MLRMIPTGFYLLVKPDDEVLEKEIGKKEGNFYKRESGILIAEGSESVLDAQRKRAAQEVGTLVAIGPIAWYDYAKGQKWAEVGDRVVFAKYAGKFVNDPVTDELLILLQDSDIVGILKEIGEDDG